MEWLGVIGTFITVYGAGILAVIGGFAVLATKTPNKADDRIIQIILDVVNFLAANFGKAKNELPPE